MTTSQHLQVVSDTEKDFREWKTFLIFQIWGVYLGIFYCSFQNIMQLGQGIFVLAVNYIIKINREKCSFSFQ